MTDWYCYTGGLHNAKRKIEKSDIKKAFEWYRQQTGHDAKVIRIHPKIQYLAGELPDGIQVISWLGTASWSIDMAERIPVPPKDALSEYQPAIVASQKAEDCNPTRDGFFPIPVNNTAKTTSVDGIINRPAGEMLSFRQTTKHLSMFGT